jgi:hypothetical protein
MNDDVQPPDTPEDELEAVNAVLDGLATDHQRALVEASPQLTQLLAEFQADRRAVAQVQVSAQARESHIAAALAAFDDLNLAGAAAVAPAAAAAARTSTNVVSMVRHRGVYRTLLGAAAAVVLVVGGVAALSSQRDSDQNSAASAATAADAKVGGDEAATLDAPAPELAATGSAANDAAADQSAQASTAMTENTAAPAMADAAAEAPADTTAAADTSAAPRSTIGSIGAGGAEALQRVDDDAQLKSYVAAPPAAAAPQPVAACGPSGSEVFGNVSYQGTPAVVLRDPDTGQILVYALDDCRLLTTLQT